MEVSKTVRVTITGRKQQPRTILSFRQAVFHQNMPVFGAHSGPRPVMQSIPRCSWTFLGSRVSVKMCPCLLQVWQTHTSLVSYTISERIFCECDPFETCTISCHVSSELGREGTEYFALTLASVLLRNKTEDQLRQGLSRGRGK